MNKLVMSLPIEKYSLSETTNDLAKVKIYVYHNGYNPNGSYFEDDCFENSKDSFSMNKPICCAYRYDDEGNIINFGEHDDEESPCGVVHESSNYHLEDVDDQTWAVVDGIIFKEYCPDAYELLKDGKKISMEIEVLDGFKGSDGFYHIKKYNLLCITLLGDYEPAMGENATIDLYSNISNNELFVAKFTEIINKANELKGGNKMNRKGIIAKFSSVKNIEGYQAIIDNKDLTDEELEKQLFTLSQRQIEEYISEELSKEKIIKKYWDGEPYTCEKYWLEDTIPSENIAILWSREDYKNYGITYTLSGDKATLDFANIKRWVRGDWRLFNDGEEEQSNPVEMFSTEIIEKAQEEINNIKESFKVEETEEYKTLENNLKDVKSQFTTLQSEKVAIDDELETLRQFKLTKENEDKKAEIDTVLEEYSQLKDIDGYDEIVKDVYSSEKEQLITNLKVFAFDNGVVLNKKQKFTKKEEPKQLLNDNNNETKNIKSVWNILDKYVPNK